MQRSVGRWLSESPFAQVVLGASVLAIAFPRDFAGSIAVLALVACGSIALAKNWAKLPEAFRKPPADFTGPLVLALVTAIGITTFWATLTESPDWQMGDWGPQRTALTHLMPHLPGLGAPAWDHTVSTGDAPFDLYPAFAYRIIGHLALVLGVDDDLSLALMITAVLVHIGIAVGTTAIAMRIAPKPVALVVGLVALVDGGAVAHGGLVGLFRWALLHSAMSLAFSLIAACGVIDALRRPRLRSTLLIWIGTALACAAHPVALVGAGASMIALVGVAVLATDVPMRRAFAAIVHIGIGCALAAWIWMPLGARIVAYGEHFSNALHTPAGFFAQQLQWATPVTWFALVAYAGFIGIAIGIWSRRATVIFAVGVALVLFVGMTDAPYLAFDLAPGRGIARLGTERLAQLARPFVGAAAAYLVAVVYRHVRDTWKDAPPPRRSIAVALVGIMSVVMLRAVPDLWRTITTRALAETHVTAPDKDGRDLLVEWAKAQMRDVGPGRWARALFDEDTHEEMHLTAETGMPTFHTGPIPDMLLRERMENTSPASLARFDFRWAIAIGKSPSVGDEKSEIELGTYHIREIKEWDGKFARIEKGEPGAQVVTTKLDGEAVDIEVTGTTKPVLVALGTGYYPRWRATHDSGVDEPVYPTVAIPDGKFHVVSAWVKPGRTRFTCDGPLPSDGAGRLISIAAVLFALAAIVLWSRRRWRTMVLRTYVQLRRRIPARAIGLATRWGTTVILVLVFGRGILTCVSPARDVGVGSGLRGIATVEAREPDGTWQTCGYSRVAGEYNCPGLVTIYDASATTISDGDPSSWGFITPAIAASLTSTSEVRITLTARLEGEYFASSGSGITTLAVDGALPVDVTHSNRLSYEAKGDRTITLTATIDDGNWSFSMVRVDSLLDEQPMLPPPVAPAF